MHAWGNDAEGKTRPPGCQSGRPAGHSGGIAPMMDVVLFILALALACHLMKLTVTVHLQPQPKPALKPVHRPRALPQSDPLYDWLFSKPSTNLSLGPREMHQNLSRKRVTKAERPVLTENRKPLLECSTHRQSINEALKRAHPDHGGHVEEFMRLLKARRLSNS